MSFLDNLDTSSWGDAATGLLPADLSSGLDTSGFDLSSSLGDFFGSPASAGTLMPPQNLPLTGSGSVGGVFGDISRLITGVYAGEAQLTALKNANAIAKAQAANQLETVRTTPNIWLVLGIGAAGFFALELMDRRK